MATGRARKSWSALLFLWAAWQTALRKSTITSGTASKRRPRFTYCHVPPCMPEYGSRFHVQYEGVGEMMLNGCHHKVFHRWRNGLSVGFGLPVFTNIVCMARRHSEACTERLRCMFILGESTCVVASTLCTPKPFVHLQSRLELARRLFCLVFVGRAWLIMCGK